MGLVFLVLDAYLAEDYSITKGFNSILDYLRKKHFHTPVFCINLCEDRKIDELAPIEIVKDNTSHLTFSSTSIYRKWHMNKEDPLPIPKYTFVDAMRMIFSNYHMLKRKYCGDTTHGTKGIIPDETFHCIDIHVIALLQFPYLHALYLKSDFANAEEGSEKIKAEDSSRHLNWKLNFCVGGYGEELQNPLTRFYSRSSTEGVFCKFKINQLLEREKKISLKEAVEILESYAVIRGGSIFKTDFVNDCTRTISSMMEEKFRPYIGTLCLGRLCSEITLIPDPDVFLDLRFNLLPIRDNSTEITFMEFPRIISLLKFVPTGMTVYLQSLCILHLYPNSLIRRPSAAPSLVEKYKEKEFEDTYSLLYHSLSDSGLVGLSYLNDRFSCAIDISAVRKCLRVSLIQTADLHRAYGYWRDMPTPKRPFFSDFFNEAVLSEEWLVYVVKRIKSSISELPQSFVTLDEE